MTKAELVSRIAEKTNTTKKSADAVLKCLVETLQQALKDEGQVRIDGLGTFKVVERKARTGVNPGTGAKLDIPACKVPSFKAAMALREAVRGPENKPFPEPAKVFAKKPEKKKK
ncbi:MAG: HU family DNA-binding protein [Pseudomonadota bacterium]